MKAFLVVALFISTSSLASLSEAIFKWKGFLLDALTFYRAHFSVPAAELVSALLGKELPPGVVDVVVLLTLFHGAMVRAVLLRRTRGWQLASEIGAPIFGYISMLGLIVYAILTMPSREEDLHPAAVWVAYPIFLLVAYRNNTGAARLLAVTYMLFPVLAVAVLAAIVNGLLR